MHMSRLGIAGAAALLMMSEANSAQPSDDHRTGPPVFIIAGLEDMDHLRLTLAAWASMHQARHGPDILCLGASAGILILDEGTPHEDMLSALLKTLEPADDDVVFIQSEDGRFKAEPTFGGIETEDGFLDGSTPLLKVGWKEGSKPPKQLAHVGGGASGGLEMIDYTEHIGPGSLNIAGSHANDNHTEGIRLPRAA